MSDIGDAPLTGNPDRDVVLQLARRIARDADLAYLIGPFTTTHDRLVVAFAAATGLDDAQARAALRYQGGERVEILKLRERVKMLEARLDECEPGWEEGDSRAARLAAAGGAKARIILDLPCSIEEARELCGATAGLIAEHDPDEFGEDFSEALSDLGDALECAKVEAVS